MTGKLKQLPRLKKEITCVPSAMREKEKRSMCVCTQLVLNKNIYINCGGSIIKNIMTVDAPTKQSSQTAVLVHSPK